MSGPPPKPAHLRQRTNKKAGAAMLEAALSGVNVPEIPNPDGREWHPLTIQSWHDAWTSEMAGKWLVSDTNGLGRVAVLWDDFYKTGDAKVMAEIRLQEQRFGLSPLDRSRLQWEVVRAEEAEQKRRPPQQLVKRTGTNDPRAILMAVK
jgi:hypothetical protein